MHISLTGSNANAATLAIDLTNATLVQVSVDDSIPMVPRESIAFGYSRIQWSLAASGSPATVTQWDVGASAGGGQFNASNYIVYTGGVFSGAVNGSLVYRYSHGITVPSSAHVATGAGSSGQPQFDNFVLTKLLDANTINEINGALMADPAPSVTVSLTKTDSTGVAIQWFTYKLTQAIVASFALDTDASGALTEQVSLSSQRMEWDYVQSDGTTQTATYNIASGQP